MRVLQRSPAARSGFTLLELIVVIIIVGVLASLALPRFFSVIVFSRSAEARVSIGAIRQGMERCYLMNGDIQRCLKADMWAGLGIDNPGNSPGAHFSYTFGFIGKEDFYIQAMRNVRDGGKIGDEVRFCKSGNDFIWCGVGKFVGIGQQCPAPVNICQ